MACLMCGADYCVGLKTCLVWHTSRCLSSKLWRPFSPASQGLAVEPHLSRLVRTTVYTDCCEDLVEVNLYANEG